MALTRAQHQSIVWWANADRSACTALARVLFARTGGAVDPRVFGAREVPVPTDARIIASFRPLVDAAQGTVEVGPIDARPDEVVGWSRPASGAALPELTVASLGPVPDRSGNRWSFSAIVDRATTADLDSSDPSMSDGGAGDEQADWDAGPGAGPARWTGATTDTDDVASITGGEGVVPSGPLADLPAGTAFGTLVHSVLEEVDFAAADLVDQLDAAVGRQLEWRSMDLTPLGAAGPGAGGGTSSAGGGTSCGHRDAPRALCDGARLADIGPADRLNEVSFDLRLATGGPGAGLPAIGEMALAHLDPDRSVGPLGGPTGGRCPRRLAGRPPDRLHRPDHAGRRPGGPAPVRRRRLQDQRPAAARAARPAPTTTARRGWPEAMADHDYPLQALLYSVALHRYLRWRLPAYRPEVHLGGAAYLFLRGMVRRWRGRGAAPPRSGVYEWPLPAGLVVGLSDLLDGRAATVAS